MVKKGDTLIEVTLAVGIFSMIAIAVVAVMSGGTSSAQSALETTLAREEIDTQAEALRFIQSAYIADKDAENSPYQELWKEITNNANTLSETDNDKTILQFTPRTCSELYDSTNGIVNQKAFVINPRMLSKFEKAEDVYISFDENKFLEAETYPRLIYGTNDKTELAASDIETSLFRAEGIYVIAVKDEQTTNIVSGANNSADTTSAFYDFYIRTCWYGTDADRPSTISTVIRLLDPSAVKTNTNPATGD